MTPSRDVDEIASALIDGALGPDEAEAAHRDPAVAVRAAEMQAARQAVRRVPPPDPVGRDDAIAAALAAADLPSVPGYDVSGDPGASGGLDAPADDRRPGPVTPLPLPPRSPQVVPMGPARRRRWTDPRWLGAAAAVALVLALGGVLATRSADSDSSDQAATAADSAPSTSGGGSAPGSGSGGGTGGAESGSGDSSSAAPDQAAPGVAPDQSSEAPSRDAPVDLGDVRSAGELAERAEHALANTSAGSHSDSGSRTGSDSESNADQSTGGGPLAATGACADPLASPSEDAGPVVLQARATLAGRPVDVWVHDDGTSRRMVAVATDGSCAVVADRPVPG